MITILKLIWAYFCAIQLVFIDRKTKYLIRQDLTAYCEWLDLPTTLNNFFKIFAKMPEVRSVVYYRLKRRYRLLPSLILPSQTNCYICAEVSGGGLKLIHGFSTIIFAKSLGDNCTIFQQVTIGYSRGEIPTVGDNCVVCCGAKILGNVTIGNNVIIGANAVVTHDIPDNSVVAGAPAKVISKVPEEQNPLDWI